MTQNPIDDDFLKHYRRAPRPEFARHLYEQLQRGDSMLAQSRYSLNGHQVPARRPLWDQRLTLAAALLALVLLGSMVVLVNIPRASRPPLNTAPQFAVSPITSENAARLQLLSTLGEGFITGVIWSPDGSLLALSGSLGVWIYNPDDLEQPLALLPDDAAAYSRLMRFSPDSQRLLVSTQERILVWDIATQALVSPPMDTGNIISFDINPNGTLIAAGSYDGRLMVYDVETGEVKTEFTITYAYTPIMDVTFSPDGTNIAFTGSQMPLLILNDPTAEWNNVTSEPRVLRPEVSEAGISSINFSPDGTRIAARVYTNVYLWQLDSGEYTVLTPEQDPNQTIGKGGGGDLTFSPDGTRLVTADSAIRIWDLQQGTSEIMQNADGLSYAAYVAFNPDWTRAALVDSSGVLRIRDMTNGEVTATMDRYSIQQAADIAFSPDGATLASVTSDNAVRFWDVTRSGRDALLRTLDFEGQELWGYQQLSYQPDAGTLALLTLEGIEVLDPSAETLRPFWQDTVEAQFTGYGGIMEYSPDGSRLAVASRDGSAIVLLDAQTGEVSRSLVPAPGTMVRDLAFSPDGQQMAVSLSPALNQFGGGGGSEVLSYPIQILNPVTGETLATLAGGTDASLQLTYTPDGAHLLALIPGTTVDVWDVASAERTMQLESGNSASSFAVSPEGSLLVISLYDATLENNVLHLWDLHGDFSTPLSSMDDPMGCTGLTFNAEGTLLAAIAYDGTLKLWGVP
ncbi:MAG: hypothetical protein U0694_17515 [Anaerolineae bacterium]